MLAHVAFFLGVGFGSCLSMNQGAGGEGCVVYRWWLAAACTVQQPLVSDSSHSLCCLRTAAVFVENGWFGIGDWVVCEWGWCLRRECGCKMCRSQLYEAPEHGPLTFSCAHRGGPHCGLRREEAEVKAAAAPASAELYALKRGCTLRCSEM